MLTNKEKNKTNAALKQRGQGFISLNFWEEC